MGAAEDVECLLEIAIVRQRSPIAGKQRIVTGMSDRGLFEHRDRLGLLPRGPERLCVLQGRVGVLGVGTKAIAIRFNLAPRVDAACAFSAVILTTTSSALFIPNLLG